MIDMGDSNNSGVLYRISNRINHATINVANALSRHQGYVDYHYITDPSSVYSADRGYFFTDHGLSIRYIGVDDLREINKYLARRVGLSCGGETNMPPNWRHDDPPPDILIINQGSGVSPAISDAFKNKPVVLFYAEYYSISNFYPRDDWPMPSTMADIDVDYRKRAHGYADKCDAIIVPTHYAKSLWPARYQSKIHVVFEGFDTTQLAPERILSMSNYGSKVRRGFPGRKLVAYIAETIEPIRGFDSWIAAYKIIRNEFENVHFIVLGKDRIKYGEIGKSELNGVTSFKDYVLKRQGVSQCGMTDVTWIESLPLYDYLSLLSEIDVAMYPMYGMFANWSLFHALHMGTPVVASNRAYLPEVINDGVNGLIADPDDPCDMAAKALTLLRSDELRLSIRKKGRETVENRYSIMATSESLKRVLSLLEK